ncbi:MAG: 4Fe-4S binding protein [Syntrophales bacterium]|nr:4Fe-4S binding protein [Syntrophales bacterium]MDD5642587.1 4Fe-4S binding protein [Syntrophales bacterium]
MAKRAIVRIDQEKCDGCGLCVPSCAEGAIQIVDGKAQLLADRFCDGLGACLGECPQGALIIEERDAEPFEGPAPGSPAHHEAPAPEPEAFVCPGSRMQQFERPQAAPAAGASALGHWPVKLSLVQPKAPFFQDASLLVAADCAPFAAGDFHAKYLQGRALVCGCPKFDNLEAHTAKLTEILKQNDIKEITITNMEVPCCHGLVQIVRQALQASGKNLPVTICTLGATGQVMQQQKIKAK